jgi:hypothetical protein
MPAQIFLLGLPLRINDYLHSHFIEIIQFIFVQNFELNTMALTSIGDFEEKPL